MANATPADVRAGWEIFREDPELTLDELNRELAARGHGPVADRSLRHYRGLLQTGYDRYVSVNRFDVARASRPYEGASATARYFYYASDVAVRVSFIRGTDAYEAEGRAARVGEVGALLRFEEPTVVAALSQAKPTVNSYVQVEFLGPSIAVVLARVIDSEVSESDALIEVEFTRLRAISELTGNQPLAVQAFQIEVRSLDPDDHAADLIGRRIYYLLEAIESARAITNDVVRSEAVDASFMVDPPQVNRLLAQNPLLVDLVTVPAVGTVVLVAWHIVRSGVETAVDAYARLQAARIDKATARKVEAEARTIELDNEIKDEQAQLTKVLYDVAREEVRHAVVLSPPKASDEARRSTLAADVLGSAESLSRQDVNEVEIRAEDQPPSEAA